MPAPQAIQTPHRLLLLLQGTLLTHTTVDTADWICPDIHPTRLRLRILFSNFSFWSQFLTVMPFS